jgi:hypothetical protein
MTKHDKSNFFEAWVLLLLSHLGLKILAFKHIESVLNGRWRNRPDRALDTADAQQEIKFVKIALSRAARVLPWESRCLSRSITAFIMFRRRQIPAVMVLGVKIEDCSLLAHAWVYVGHDVINQPQATENAAFKPLMSIG